MEATQSSHCSEPFQLNPGVASGSQVITECVVQLLTRGDRKVISAVTNDGDRADVWLAWSIARLGPHTDRETIKTLTLGMLEGDEERVQREIEKLRARFADKVETADLAFERILRPTDIVSEGFALSPGIVVDEKQINTCKVRLLTRGDLKALDKVNDEQERDDLAMLLSIYQLGDITEVTPAHVDMLTAPDEEKINQAIKELRAKYSPGSKSKCPACGHTF